MTMLDAPGTETEAADSAGAVERVDDATVRLPSGELLRICAYPGCEATFTVNSPSQKRYCCTDHKGWKRPRAGSAAQADRPPASVQINLPGPGKPKAKDPALAAVEKRLASIAGIASVAVLLMGQPLDAADIERHRATWAAAGAELAAYEPWLRKLAAGGETSERFMAWLKFLAATGAMALPIILRHDVLPAPIANLLHTMESTPEVDVMGRVFAAMASETPGDGPASAAA